MRIGLYDVDSHNFPNLPLMKLSAYHKAQGDTVEFMMPLEHYDRVYVSKIFGDEYSNISDMAINADEVVFGGTGFAITIEDGKEVYHKDRDPDLPYEVEHIYPDYSLYPEYTNDTAYGFLTRGCCNGCGYCIVTQKEGRCSLKVANLNEWWHGQKYIKLLDPNLLACKDRMNLIQQLIDSGAWVDFTQGLDAKFITPTIAVALKCVKTKLVHFAFDRMEYAEQIVNGLRVYKEATNIGDRKAIVYMLTNYDTTFEQDMERIRMIRGMGYIPDVRIYRKHTAAQFTRDLQRWCNNRWLYRTTSFAEYVPRKDGKTIRELYPEVNIIV